MTGPGPGDELGVGDWFEITQDRVDAFAEITEDDQWIHRAGDRADSGPFGGPIAHGFLTLSLAGVLVRDLAKKVTAGSRMVINYGLDRVRFITPVPVGSRIRGRLRLLDVEAVEGGRQVKYLITIELEGSDRPAAVAESLARLYD